MVSHTSVQLLHQPSTTVSQTFKCGRKNRGLSPLLASSLRCGLPVLGGWRGGAWYTGSACSRCV